MIYLHNVWQAAFKRQFYQIWQAKKTLKFLTSQQEKSFSSLPTIVWRKAQKNTLHTQLPAVPLGLGAIMLIRERLLHLPCAINFPSLHRVRCILISRDYGVFSFCNNEAAEHRPTTLLFGCSLSLLGCANSDAAAAGIITGGWVGGWMARRRRGIRRLLHGNLRCSCETPPASQHDRRCTLHSLKSVAAWNAHSNERENYVYLFWTISVKKIEASVLFEPTNWLI